MIARQLNIETMIDETARVMDKFVEQLGFVGEYEMSRTEHGLYTVQDDEATNHIVVKIIPVFRGVNLSPELECAIPSLSSLYTHHTFLTSSPSPYPSPPFPLRFAVLSFIEYSAP